MIQWYFDGASTGIFNDYSNFFFRQIFPSNIPIKYSHPNIPIKYSHPNIPITYSHHIPITYSHFKGNYLSQAEWGITSQDSPSWSARLGRERVHLHDRHRGLVRGLHGRKARARGQGAGARWAERGGSP